MVNFQPIRYDIDDNEKRSKPIFPSFGTSTLELEVGLISGLKSVDSLCTPFRLAECGLDTLEDWKEDQVESNNSNEFGDWESHMDEISWTLVSADSRLASQTCHHLAPSYLVDDGKKKEGVSVDDGLGLPSDDEDITKKEAPDAESVRVPRVTIKTAFLNNPIKLSFEASELYTRFQNPDDFYGGGDSGHITLSSSGGKGISAAKRRRQQYERKKKAAVDKNLDALMSQASQMASQSQASANMMFSSQMSGPSSQGGSQSQMGSQLSSGGIGGSIGVGRSGGGGKPKKKARSGF